jgi:hypothetical protein
MAMTPMARGIELGDQAPLLARPAELRAVAADRGWLCLRGLLPSAPVLALRDQVLAVCERHGFAQPGRLVPQSALPSGPWFEFYRDLQRLRALHALAKHPAVVGAVETLLGEPVIPHPRVIGRVVFPGSAVYTTAPHQDHVAVRGTLETWTAWIPLGDCPRELGPIAVMDRSRRLGLLPLEGAFASDGRRVDLPEDAVWATGDVRCGDVVLFHSLTFHQASDNVTDRLRLSIDCRYSARSQPLDPDQLRPHLDFITWDEVDR